MEQLIADVFGIAVDTVCDDLNFDAIGSWDSLSHMQLITALEDRYKVQFSGDEIADMRYVGAVRNALHGHGVAV
jgi:acyl carrier protein